VHDGRRKFPTLRFSRVIKLESGGNYSDDLKIITIDCINPFLPQPRLHSFSSKTFGLDRRLRFRVRRSGVGGIRSLRSWLARSPDIHLLTCYHQRTLEPYEERFFAGWSATQHSGIAVQDFASWRPCHCAQRDAARLHWPQSN
jgi:hypothetical protein